MTKDVRFNGINGIIETDDVSMHFNEWWSGEGMSFSFDDKKNIELHTEELHELFVVSVVSGMVDLDQVKKDAKELKQQSKERAKRLKEISKKFKEKEYD